MSLTTAWSAGTNEPRAVGQLAGPGLSAHKVDAHVGKAVSSVIFWDFQKRLEE